MLVGGYVGLRIRLAFDTTSVETMEALWTKDYECYYYIQTKNAYKWVALLHVACAFLEKPIPLCLVACL